MDGSNGQTAQLMGLPEDLGYRHPLAETQNLKVVKLVILGYTYMILYEWYDICGVWVPICIPHFLHNYECGHSQLQTWGNAGKCEQQMRACNGVWAALEDFTFHRRFFKVGTIRWQNEQNEVSKKCQNITRIHNHYKKAIYLHSSLFQLDATHKTQLSKYFIGFYCHYVA